VRRPGLNEEVTAMTPEAIQMQAQLDDMRTMIFQIHGMLSSPKEARAWYSVEEVAAMLKRSPYTVREWCRHGRIDAEKRSERRGGAEMWRISANEVARYRDEGFLPADQNRNAG
jgi:hypothetical protein